MKKYLCIHGHQFDDPVIERPNRRIQITKCPDCGETWFGIQTAKTIKNCFGGIHWSDPEFTNNYFCLFMEMTGDELSEMFKSFTITHK